MRKLFFNRIGAMGLAAGVCLSGGASAATSLSITGQPATPVAAVGDTVVVTIKLVETRQSNADSSILVGQNGLFGFDFRVNRTVGSSTLSDASIASGLWPTPPIVNFQPVKPFPATLSLLDATVSTNDDPSVLANGPIGSLTADPLVRELVLGTVTVKVTDTSTFQVGDSPIGDNTLTWIGNPMDASIQSGSFFIAVPEPTSLGIGAMVCGFLLSRSRKRSL